MNFEKREITKKSENISQWYNDIVLKAELADYGPAKGTMILRPYGYAIWEAVIDGLDPKFKEDGVENAYFPMFIPSKLLQKEKEHVEGFSPELAIVTIGGGEKLAEPLVIRPTSETIMYEAYSRWIHSYRDLPLKINQWNSVVRWEKRTYLFMRTSEFLWQEGHTAHATEKEADEMARKGLGWYKDFYQENFAIYALVGVKSNAEKFAGAQKTYTVELLMPDGRALQAATSHNLGDNFSKAFDIKFQDEKGESKYVFQTSWGFSWRSLGGLVLVHGDDNGLVLPPKVAPIQVVIIPVSPKEPNGIKDYTTEITIKLKGLKIKVDDSQNTVGWKFNQWELKGVPLRVEVGIREQEKREVTLARRDTGEKITVSLGDLKTKVDEVLESIQQGLLERSEKFVKENTRMAENYDAFKQIMNTTRGFVLAFWCEGAECEKKIKEETKASTRFVPLDAKEEDGKCIYCGKPAKHRWLFAQSY